MIGLLAAVGWGLLACGAVAHLWHHDTLRRLLAAHLDRERVPAVALTAVEALLAVALPVGVLSDASWLPAVSVAAFVVAIGFVAWIARLLFSGSSLPCACSFSSAPTTWWSLGRAACVLLVGLFAAGERVRLYDVSTATRLATLLVGWAIAWALFVLPEAVTWPATSRALLARVDAHVVST